MNNIAEILQHHAEQFPDGAALIDTFRGKPRRISFGDLDRIAGKTALLFQKAGLRYGNRILVLLPMSTELYVSLAAMFRMGVTAMFIDPSAGREAINEYCRILPPDGFVANAKGHLLRLAIPALRRIPRQFSVRNRIPFVHPLEGAKNLQGTATIVACHPDHPALVTMTSGSTGTPKVAVRTHGFLFAQHRAIESALQLHSGDVELATLPIFVLANLASRVTSIIAHADFRRPAFIQPQPVIEQILQLAPNRAAASPAFWDRIASACEQRDVTFPSLQKIFTGGGPVPPSLLDRLQRIAPQAAVVAVYGATEAEPISILKAADLDGPDRVATRQGQGLLVGTIVPSLNVRVMTDQWGEIVGPLTSTDFAAMCLQTGQIGEIVVQGAHVLRGYLNGVGDRENKFTVDETVWHRTGDAGYFDNRGRLWLMGRCAAKIDDEHGVLYPLGIEQAAIYEPNISQAALVANSGRRLLAVTLRDRNIAPQQDQLLQTFSFAHLDGIRVMKKLPLDQRHQAKIDYVTLRQQIAKRS